VATRIEEIIVRVRDTIGDPNSERWTDAQLLRFIDDAQKQLVNQAGLLRGKVDISLVVNAYEYSVPANIPLYHTALDAAGAVYLIPIASGITIPTVPTNLFKLTRVIDNLGDVIPFQTRSDLDKRYGSSSAKSGVGWELKTGSAPRAIVVDKNNPKTIRIFPIPVSISTINTLTLFFTKKATPLVAVTDSLEIDDEFDNALKFYVTGMALRVNQDAQNRQMATEELQAFTGELARAKRQSSTDFAGPAAQFDATYVGGI